MNTSNEKLLKLLQVRFEKNMNRHKNLKWDEIKKKLESNSEILYSINEMEKTGGEPDVVILDKEEYYCDCSAESPKGRRSICYDSEGQKEREKEGIHPHGNAVDMASDMKIELLNEEQYRELQKIGDFDLKTSSWIKNSPDIRKLGGAVFADSRYEHVFIYHNSAKSFYASRGFRGCLRI